MIEFLPWVILFLPLASAVIITLLFLNNRTLSAGLSIGAVCLGFLGSVLLCFNEYPPEQAYAWLDAGGLLSGSLKLDFGFRLDRLSLLMLLIVTGVGSLIHIYSYQYMAEDKSRPRFFAALSLFTFSMLGIVLANNFVMMFIFWELVGVSSYLLIGFWHEKASAGDAAKKAFLTNRIGDFGFLLGIILLWSQLGTVNFFSLEHKLLGTPLSLDLLTVAGLLIFCGAMGKSAQFPLHVWLPDAMEGPTPVSALIHAATMVAAGVYMICRVFFLFTPGALEAIAWIGGITSILAALMAVQQDDIKRILAYSTLSQLGYMVMAVGLEGPSAAMFHLTTHAFFKALLFLGAGAVIYALHHEQDIWRMGGLRKKLPITYLTFLIGTLALCGVPPFSGFYSKDSILAVAYEHNIPLFIIAVLVAVLTTFYMFRLMFVAFIGPAKSHQVDHAHEAPKSMLVPLMILAVLSAIAGLIGLEGFIHAHFDSDHHHVSFLESILYPFNHSIIAALSGIGAIIVGFCLAFALYAEAKEDPLPQKLGVLSRVMRNKFYLDEFYRWVISLTHDAWAALADWADRWLVGGLGVRGLHGTTEFFGRALRLVQTGSLQTYAILFAAGVAVVLYFALR